MMTERFLGEASITVVRDGKELYTIYGAGPTMREALIDALKCKLREGDSEPQFGDRLLIENR